MIEVPTTLVLGAGASMPYMFPSGYDLLLEICTLLAPDVESKDKTMLIDCGFDKDRLHRLRHDLMRSGTKSVDAFLERRTEFVREGKAAIASVLIGYENPSKVVERSATSNWYEYLWGCISTSQPEQLLDNKLSILTFNYDRSLEYYLFNAIRYTYGLPEDKARDYLMALPILHLHGQLGQLKEVVGEGRNFDSTRSTDAIRTAAEGVVIIHETEEGNETFQRARSILAASSIICFLGFGYHPTNLRRLGVEKLQHVTLTGTVLGMTISEIHQVRKQLGRGFDLVGYEILTFLREHGVLIGGVEHRG
jgi:hypothetical protein